MIATPGARSLARLLVAGVTVAMSGVAARAAPSAPVADATEADPPAPVCEATPSLEEAKLITARDLHLRGEESFGKRDYLGAVAAWTQVVVLMPEAAANLRVQLAHAHRGAYTGDEDEHHLRSAHALFTEQLASLRPDDAARKDLDAEIGEIEATLAALEEAKVREQAEHEEAIRQEQIRRNQRVLAEAEAKHQRNIQKIYYGAGGSLAGLGVGSLAAMAVFLAGGARTDREGRELAGTTNVPEGRYQELLVQGQSYNRAAVVTGVIGGVLTLSGASLLVVAAIRHERVMKPLGKQVAVSPALDGVRLRF